MSNIRFVEQTQKGFFQLIMQTLFLNRHLYMVNEIFILIKCEPEIFLGSIE